MHKGGNKQAIKSSKKDELSDGNQKATNEKAEGQSRNDKPRLPKDSEICVDCRRAVLESQQGLCCDLCGL